MDRDERLDLCSRIDRIAAALAGLRELVRPDREPIWRGAHNSCRLVLDVVCEQHNIELSRLIGHQRSGWISRLRRMAIAAMRSRYQAVLEQIGHEIGRDHTTIIYHLRTHEKSMAREPGYARDYEELIKRLEAADKKDGTQ